MNDVASIPVQNPRRLRLDWIPMVLFSPRLAFSQISKHQGSVWFLPLLVLSLTAVFYVVASGPLRREAAINNQGNLPSDFYFPPEQQEQLQQALAATQGPVFIYVFPAFTAVAGVWAGWLLVGGIIHLTLTMLGGRGATGSVMNLVAWGALPFAVRDLVRIISVLSTHRLITHSGISGFAPAGDGSLLVYLASLLALIDIYIIWHAVLIVIGIWASDGLPLRKIATAVSLVILFALLLQALVGLLAARFSSLTIIRPFF